MRGHASSSVATIHQSATVRPIKSREFEQMALRIRPLEFEVCKDDPFHNDLLNRRPSIEALTNVLGALHGPCVLALDSEWGGGKTAFIKMWAAYLRNEGYPVAEFNAWETDFSGDPFIALSSRLEDHFDAISPSGAAQDTRHFAEAAKRLALRAVPVVIRLASQGLLDSGSMEQVLAAEVSSYAENRLHGFREGQESISEFREVLQQKALNLSKENGDRSLFVMIDEMDRCRPSYAVELLEVAKHLFSADRIIFVLAVNRSQLAHSVKTLYGAEFNAEGYLCRFFDLDYTLPLPDREQFVLKAFHETGLNIHFNYISGPLEHMSTMNARLLSCSSLDLRSIAQVVRRLSLACASLGDSFPGVTAGLSIACVLRALDFELYLHLSNGDIPDIEIIDRLYGIGTLRTLQHTPEGYFLEAAISVTWCGLSLGGQRYSDIRSNSPHVNDCISTRNRLEERSRELGPREGLSEEERRKLSHSHGVVSAASALEEMGDYAEYSSIIRHIELFPSDEALRLSM